MLAGSDEPDERRGRLTAARPHDEQRDTRVLERGPKPERVPRQLRPRRIDCLEPVETVDLAPRSRRQPDRIRPVGAGDGYADAIRPRGDQCEACCSHEPERALRPAEQSRQVISGVVLDQPVEVRDHRTVPEHGLHTENIAAHGAVPEHAGASRIRSDHPPDGGASAGTEVNAELPTRSEQGSLERGERYTGFDSCLACRGVDVPDPVEALHRDEYPACGFRPRYPTPHQAGIPALRDERHAVVATDVNHGPNLAGVPRSHHNATRADEPTGPVGLEPGSALRIRQYMGAPDRSREFGLEGSLLHACPRSRSRQAPMSKHAPTTVTTAPKRVSSGLPSTMAGTAST
ncbi:unannotated protein [freshwater metagenome]|uniref:Unannotated protein n=1 Tax=freshwater metagenome TaxID=449393 RepID=A0A6J7UT50_9ZZZZ